MSFDRRDIRTSMDVYTADNDYLGTVLRVLDGPLEPHGQSLPAPGESSRVSGELLGPMPTLAVGNGAALKQGAAAHYGAMPDSEPIGAGIIVVGRWWGLRNRRFIPLQDVQTVSLERIVVR